MIIKKHKTKFVEEEVQQPIEESKVEETVEVEQNENNDDDIDIFNLDNIDFKQRRERRRGDRRRGFRRIDDRNLISRAKEEATAIKEAASKEGYQAGIEAAQSDIEEFRNELGNFLSARQEVYDEIAPDILDISFEIAKKIIKKEVSDDNNIILNNIKDILQTLSKDETKITLKVNPTQVDVVKREIPNSAQNIGLEAKILIISDNSISEGGCIISTTNGLIESTIESQLSVISEVLKGI